MQTFRKVLATTIDTVTEFDTFCTQQKTNPLSLNMTAMSLLLLGLGASKVALNIAAKL